MHQYKKVSLLLGALALTSVSFGLAGGTLRYAPKVGAVHKYKVMLNAKVKGVDISTSGFSTDTVTKIAPNGIVTVTTMDSGLVIVINGNKVNNPQADGPGTTKLTRPDGTVAQIIGKDTSPEEYRRETLDTVEFPSTKLSVGTSWVWNCAANAKLGIVKARGKFVVLASERIHGVDTWKVSTSISELEGATPASSHGTAWISKADGVILRADVKEVKLPLGELGTVDGTVHAEVVS